MTGHVPERRLINNELATRAVNKRAKEMLKDYTPQEEQPDLAIDFYCECSDENCNARVSLTLKKYEKLHDDYSKFVIAKGHQEPKIEKIKKNEDKLLVVEKYAL